MTIIWDLMKFNLFKTNYIKFKLEINQKGVGRTDHKLKLILKKFINSEISWIYKPGVFKLVFY